MEINKNAGNYVVKGGKTILGRLYAYQERTGLSLKEILNLPYIYFVISMLDAPSIDYEESKEQKGKKQAKKETKEFKTAEEEARALASYLGG